MCVERPKSKHLTRGEVLAGIAGASVFAFGSPVAAAPAPAHGPPFPTQSWPNLKPGASSALRIALGSRLIQDASSEIYGLALAIRRQKTGSNIRDLLRRPVPTYARRLRDPNAREKLRADLLQAGFIEKIDSIDSFLPDSSNPMTGAPQPFFTTAGSSQNSHHAYPGGLVLHELFNARSAIALAQNYDREYFSGKTTIDRDVVVAAALYHDIMKTVVFQWNNDGTLTLEPNIAGTGGHHVLSGAEAIARGEDARFIIVLLSAHAAPSLGDEAKVADWARAAAMIAGVDPIDYGLLKKNGQKYELAMVPPIEAFINNLSDHDYVLSVHAMHQVAPLVDEHIQAAGITASQALWHRNALLANVSAITLYQTLANDRRVFDRDVDRRLSEVRL